jgi:photosystem II stability/assembly factor-like uncharacterized protein
MMRYTFALAGLAALAIGNAAHAQRGPEWVPLAPAPATVSSIAVSSGRVPLILVGSELGVFRSTDGGSTWGSTALTTAAGTVAIDPRRPSLAYAGVYGHPLLRSTDGGLSWTPTIIGFQIQSIAFDPVLFDNVYVATNEGVFITLDSHWNGILARSTDGGVSWGFSSSALGLENEMVTSVAAGPSETPGGSRVFAGVADGGPAGRPVGLLTSSDGGDRWVAVSGVLQELSIISIAPDRDPAVVAVLANSFWDVTSPRGVYRTTDAGGTWSMSSPQLDGRFISQLLPDPVRLHVSYAATDDGVYISTDAAGSWSPLGHGLEGRLVTMLAANPDGAAIYAVTDEGIFVLENGAVDPVTPRSPVPVGGR